MLYHNNVPRTIFRLRGLTYRTQVTVYGVKLIFANANKTFHIMKRR